MKKRIFDLIFGLPGLLFLSPLFLMIAIVIRLDSSGPVFFRQKRIGRFGREFLILKFRTMVPNAESFGPKITVSKDPRITRSGYFLRKYKLDELPQLINVVKGDMSLVGPRPEVPEYVAKYPDEVREKILSMRPGITDLSSLVFRDEDSLLASEENPTEVYVEKILPEKLAYCERYFENQNLWLDFKIILRTLLAIFR